MISYGSRAFCFDFSRICPRLFVNSQCRTPPGVSSSVSGSRTPGQLQARWLGAHRYSSRFIAAMWGSTRLMRRGAVRVSGPSVSPSVLLLRWGSAAPARLPSSPSAPPR